MIMVSMKFPTNCIKGIPNSDFIKEGIVLPHLFYFSEQARDDDWKEQSINWKDNENAIKLTMEQRKEDGELQFKIGVAIIPRDEIDRLSRLPTVNGVLSYERKPLNDNPYHGNLLLKNNVSTILMKAIAAGLALAVAENRLRQSEYLL